jgi:hypothetical protein
MNVLKLSSMCWYVSEMVSRMSPVNGRLQRQNENISKYCSCLLGYYVVSTGKYLNQRFQEE